MNKKQATKQPELSRNPVRSTLFNITFILVNCVCCIVWLPTLLLPRKNYIQTLNVYYRIIRAIEYYVLNLRYEVIGAEHLPKDGPFIVGAKHMSTYETFKLNLLFNDPAIILKKELLYIPLWGLFLKKTGAIAIDRSTPERATKTIKSGSIKMKKAGRPIVIFPQGTRVYPHETSAQKRYKSGIYRIQNATKMPIIPMATNSGLFWPRSGWLKSSGVVIFKFLEPIEHGKTKKELMSELEKKIEDESNKLMDETLKAQKKPQEPPRDRTRKALLWPFILAVLCIGAGVYTYAWHEIAKNMQREYSVTAENLGRIGEVEEPIVSGFPGHITLTVFDETFRQNEFTLTAQSITAKIWPIPNLPIKLETGPMILEMADWPGGLNIDSINATFIAHKNKIVELQNARIQKTPLKLGITGTIDLNQEPMPRLNTTIAMSGFETLIDELAEKNIIEERMAPFFKFGFNNLKDQNGVVKVNLAQRGNKLFAGPIPIADIPAPNAQIQSLSTF